MTTPTSNEKLWVRYEALRAALAGLGPILQGVSIGGACSAFSLPFKAKNGPMARITNGHKNGKEKPSIPISAAPVLRRYPMPYGKTAA